MANGTLRANLKDNSKRRYEGGGPRPDNNEAKRTEAAERQAAWSGLTPKQQLEALDRRLGKGQGAERQRARIQARIDNPPKASKKEPDIERGELNVVAAETRVKAKDRRKRERTERPSK
jgi:hypothetical protein